MNNDVIKWFFINKNHNVQGPVRFNLLNELYLSEHLDRNTLVWYGGLKEWTPLHQIFDLALRPIEVPSMLWSADNVPPPIPIT